MKIARVPTNIRNFFHHWVTFTQPFHKLGKTDKAVLAELLYYRYLLSQEVPSERLMYKLLFEKDTKDKICDQLKIPKSRMALILTSLRKDKIVIGRTINDKFIPDLKVGDTEFILAFKFRINDNKEGIYKKKGRKKV